MRRVAHADVGAGPERVGVPVAVPVDGSERRVVGVDAGVEQADDDPLAPGRQVGAGVPIPEAGRTDQVVTDVSRQLTHLVRHHGGHARQRRHPGRLLRAQPDREAVDDVAVAEPHVNRPPELTLDRPAYTGLPVGQVLQVRTAGSGRDVQLGGTGHPRTGRRQTRDTTGVRGQRRLLKPDNVQAARGLGHGARRRQRSTVRNVRCSRSQRRRLRRHGLRHRDHQTGGRDQCRQSEQVFV